MIFWNFVKAWARVQLARVRGYEVLAPWQVSAFRFEQCKVCPFFDGAKCDLCGCLAEAKVMISPERCPAGKWGARWVKKNATPA
jgi:hypothetical protein